MRRYLSFCLSPNLAAIIIQGLIVERTEYELPLIIAAMDTYLHPLTDSGHLVRKFNFHVIATFIRRHLDFSSSF
jgi:hypothetical protein